MKNHRLPRSASHPFPAALARVSSLATLAAATTSHAAIVTNTDLGLSGFTFGGSDVGHFDWNIDNRGLAEIRVENAPVAVGGGYGFSYAPWKSFVNASTGFGVLDYAPPFYDFPVGNTGIAALISGQSIDANGLFIEPLGSLVPLIEGFASERALFADNRILQRQFVNGQSTFMGFRFAPSDTAPFLYGWAEVTLTEVGQYGEFTVQRWAYEDSGAPIAAGQTASIPEPAHCATGLAALALGAAALRRRRATSSVASTARRRAD